MGKRRDKRALLSPPGGLDFSGGVTDPVTGDKCVTVAEEVESIAGDPVLLCTHKNITLCHYTYITQYSPAQEQVCREDYKKICRIRFSKKVVNDVVRKCYNPVKKKCSGEGQEECYTVYQTYCTTKYVKTQQLPQTECDKQPLELCGAGCEYEEAAEECHEKVVATVVEVPEEICDISPQKTCRLVTKLVPRLKPSEECTIIPKETCSSQYGPPKRVKKPLLTKWCLEESKEVQEEERSYKTDNYAKNSSEIFKNSENLIDKPLEEPNSKGSNEEKLDKKTGVVVKNVNTVIEKKFPTEKFNVSMPKFVNPPILERVNNRNKVNTKELKDENKEGRTSQLHNSVSNSLEAFNTTDRSIDNASVYLDNKISDEEKFGNRNGFEVEQVRINIEKKFPIDRLDVPGPKLAKPSIIVNDDNPNMIDEKSKEDEDFKDIDIESPFENIDDIFVITSSNELTREELNDLENFNIGIYLEQFRTNIDNSFQTQDFVDFVDFDDF